MDAKRFNRPYGIPACPLLTEPEAESISQSVHLLWNLFIGEGLLRYGFRSDAARLVAHIMTAIVQNLKQNRAFYALYHAEKGTGIGERNALTGLAPVGLFLNAPRCGNPFCHMCKNCGRESIPVGCDDLL